MAKKILLIFGFLLNFPNLVSYVLDFLCFFGGRSEKLTEESEHRKAEMV
ncbi:hypothetical protein BVRB_2g031400 [Beta vulgaris subsp. vulgaris]|nr:hypothetical protein BVRB_2g031400 [Beta vulgaris subsp. vulgaris]